MKLVKILFIALFLLSAMPVNGFCDNCDAQNVTQHCTLACHCFPTTLPDKTLSFNSPSESTFLLHPTSHTHEDPFLTTSKRPPIVLL